jgi:anti-sigma-K factor RskA
MKLTEDTDLLVGEYVLGTLEHEERKKLEEIAAREPTVQAAVTVWERRLVPLRELVEPVEPPEAVWPEIAAQLAGTEQERRPRDPTFLELATDLARGQGAGAAYDLVGKLRRWRTAALVAGAVALALAALVAAELIRPVPLPTAPLIAVLRSDVFAPPFIVALDLQARSLEIRTVPSGTADDRSYAFWLLRSDDAPVALGRLRGTGKLEPDPLKRIDRAALRQSEIAVSVEPNETLADKPSGPFVYRGKFE